MADNDPAAGLRAELVEVLAAKGTFRDLRIAEAFGAVPRHLLVPDTAVEQAYRDTTIITHRDAAGVATSSGTSPGEIAVMLEQLAAQPGHRVLDVGTGTGYSAALLSHLVGPTGQVTSVDVDPEVTTTARRNLDTAGYEQVRVLCGDGADGDPVTAPFDRIMVTAGAWETSQAWEAQLAPGGRLVVPLRIRGLTRSVALERHDGHWHSVSANATGYIPMRGDGHQPEVNLRLDDGPDDPGLILRLDDGQPADETALRHAIRGEAAVAWSGVVVADREKIGGFGDLDYWLAGVGGLCRLLTRARDFGILTPALAYGSMAVLDGDTLAYLTRRPAGGDDFELGACAYGPLAHKLAERVAEAIRAWNAHRDTASWIEIWPAGAALPESGVLVVAPKRYSQVVVRAQTAQPGQPPTH